MYVAATALGLGLTGTSPCAAQTPPDTGTTVIRAGRLFDSERGTFVADQDVLVQRGRIVQVGRNLAVPPGAKEVDLRRYTVLPGLVDAHTHLLYLEARQGSLTMEGIKSVVVEGTPLRALRAAARARTFLHAGITTVRDLGNAGQFGDVALRQAIEDGSVDGPRVFSCGPGLSPEGGQFPGLQQRYRAIAEEEYRVVRGPHDAAQAVRENVTYGANCIKIYSNATPNPASLSLEEMRAIVEEARRMNVTVAAHATSDAAVYRAALAGVNTIEHAYQVSDSTLALMKERGVALVPTDGDSATYAGFGVSAAMLRPVRDRLMRAVRAGVTIVAGSDMYLEPVTGTQGEAARAVLRAYHEAGMTMPQILQAATVNAARALGARGAGIGVIRQGYYADIIAVEGDAATDIEVIERVRWVMKNGTVYLDRRE